MAMKKKQVIHQIINISYLWKEVVQFKWGRLTEAKNQNRIKLIPSGKFWSLPI